MVMISISKVPLHRWPCLGSQLPTCLGPGSNFPAQDTARPSHLNLTRTYPGPPSNNVRNTARPNEPRPSSGVSASSCCDNGEDPSRPLTQFRVVWGQGRPPERLERDRGVLGFGDHKLPFASSTGRVSYTAGLAACGCMLTTRLSNSASCSFVTILGGNCDCNVTWRRTSVIRQHLMSRGTRPTPSEVNIDTGGAKAGVRDKPGATYPQTPRLLFQDCQSARSIL
ncbi:hypothetical protein EDB80DRAFT_819312 [Ilyonectria destructans]|nr:hypothetical protein EDB80DRAFT_819312 [Ilyonectria destructans]